MPSLDQATEPFFKGMYVGDSSSGKTGSLVSLVAAGYKLYVLDMDAGISILAAYVKKECPDKIGNVQFQQFRDKYTIKQDGSVGVKGNPKAFAAAVKLMEKWPTGPNPEDFLDPAKLGSDTFIIIDTLTTLGKAALAWAEGLSPTAKDPRQWYFTAQQAIESFVAMLMGPDFQTNVLIITHISGRELEDGSKKGFPASGAGTALGPTLAKYCNTLLLAETVGSGSNIKYKIKTTPTGFIDLKSAAPFATAKEYDLSTGLAEIVQTIKANT